MTEAEIDHLVKILWDYNHMNHQLVKADAIFALGSYDISVAERAVYLYFKGYAPFIIFSGAFGKLTRGVFEKPEADVFAEIARKRGVPEDKVLIENKSTNTGENIAFTKELLESKKLNLKKFIVVQKPYMERRAYATIKKVWPEAEIIMTSPQVSFEEYVNNSFRSKEDIINSIVADTQKIKIYQEKGFQIPQEMPEEVWSACKQLIALGFDKSIAK